MIKFLPIVILLLLVIGVLGYWRFKTASVDASTQAKSGLISTGASGSSNSDTTITPQTEQQRLRDLEEAVGIIADKVAKMNGTINKTAINPNVVPTTAPEQNSAIKQLQTSILDLQSRVEKLETPTSTKSQSPLFVPIGSNITAGNTGYYSVPGFIVSIDPAQYGNYSGMQLEVSVNVTQYNDTGHVRLINITDNSPITGSQITTQSTSSTLLTSSSFKLPAGQKNYQLQVYTNTGNDITVQNARLKISF